MDDAEHHGFILSSVGLHVMVVEVRRYLESGIAYRVERYAGGVEIQQIGDSLVAIYKSIGAQYFFVLGNHHDNFDLWDSKYQPWNSVNIGPKRDILAVRRWCRNTADRDCNG